MGPSITPARRAGAVLPPTDAWTGPLLRACSAAASTEFAYQQAPEPLDHGHGAWGFGFELAGATPAGADGGGWQGPLAARLALDRRDLDREASAMRLNARHGLGAPAVRTVVALDVGDATPPLWALISEPRAEVALPELIGFNLHQAGDILTGFASHHAAIHDLPVDQAEICAAIPVLVATDELARIDATRFPAEHEWLASRIPSAADVVLCHGGYQPLCVSGPPPSAWPDHGGPGQGLTVDNWSGAVLAEPEFDVAFTLVAFWSAHCFAPNRSERTAIKMIRNTLLNTYKLGYQSCRDVDPERVRYWQAFHALRGLARMGGAYDDAGSPFAAQDRGPLPDQLAPELQRHFKQLTRVR